MGRGFASALTAEGARLVINGTNADKLGEIEAEIIAAGGTAEPVLGSVADDAVG